MHMHTFALLAAITACTAAAATPMPATPDDTRDVRDPFLAFTVSVIERTPLQRYEVDRITVQGIIENTSSPRALVILPDGSTHVVRVGDTLGKNFGRALSIRAGTVTVREELRDWTFARIVRDTALPRHQP